MSRFDKLNNRDLSLTKEIRDIQHQIFMMDDDTEIERLRRKEALAQVKLDSLRREFIREFSTNGS